MNFVLQHTSRPQHAHDVSIFRIAEADDDIGGILSQIPVRSSDLKLLPVAAGENFNFGADGGFVVGNPLSESRSQ